MYGRWMRDEAGDISEVESCRHIRNISFDKGINLYVQSKINFYVVVVRMHTFQPLVCCL